MTDWKALCEELADALACHYPGHVDDDELLNRARAALAETVGEGPSRLRTERRTGPFGEWTALIPCNSHAPADGPAVPEGREPASVVGEPSDEELAQAAKAAIHEYKYPTELVYFLDSDSCEYEPFLLALHAAIAADRARRGRARAALAEPEPEVGEPTDEELLATLDKATADAPLPVLPEDAQVIEPTERTILVPVPVPVAVAERPWEREGWCDGQERCWWFCPESILPNGMLSYWCLGPATEPKSWFTHCLPAHALPLPQGEVQP